MRVYVVFDRYEHNEWINVFYVGTDREESIKHCKETDLPDFICYGPDDCHSFQLVEVEMTKTRFKKLLDWVEQFGSCEGTKKDRDFYDFMVDMYEERGEYSEVTDTLISTDGCSDFYEIVRYYSVFYKNKDIEEVSEHEWLFTDEYDEFYEELNDDEDLWNKVTKEYVQDTY
jgi:hypothetical protein